ncbi:MAG: phosphoglucosamine mutase [Gammaproteobacteria bacterium]|nr:phosphoglucosamine mutase [Gammaproteobacteria bacterium]NND38453.1 phosphoglucosamine mutase [Pseudomonadales bacterium]MBT8149931.1 phosphoglucosamine mutase [Gammaproteobacteria bacterium]NNL10467.1 phosphoglucosamine mutase [Pseudomonadales bacterium]NNM11068.1 phosphoglucosamine mutase [Pseudomonadales bacterium]
MSKKYFGTDGIRGRVGEGVINPEFILKLGWAVGRVFGRTLDDGAVPRVIIGKDTRISGYMFESALEAGLVAAGANVMLIGPMPTPAIAYLTRTFQCTAGIVISASHNPFYDNGIKFFSASGEKLPDEIEHAIEAEIEKPMQMVESAALGKVKRVEDAAGRYIEFCKSTVPTNFSLKGLKVVVDCAHGATYHVAPDVLRELGAEVVAVGADPDGLNINDGVGSTKPQLLSDAVLEHKADIGVAFDGDGDRVLFVDEQGRILDGDALLYIIACDRLRTKGDCSGVVGTLMSNYGFELAMRDMGVPFARAKVGDRYVKEMMQQKGWLLGGESSGHIICSDVTSTGDGVVAALKVFFAVVAGGKKLSELVADLPVYPQVMINVRRERQVDLDADPEIGEAVAATEAELGDQGRVLLRPSGTEPLIRVMVEGRDHSQVEQLASNLAATVERLVR